MRDRQIPTRKPFILTLISFPLLFIFLSDKISKNLFLYLPFFLRKETRSCFIVFEKCQNGGSSLLSIFICPWVPARAPFVIFFTCFGKIFILIIIIINIFFFCLTTRTSSVASLFFISIFFVQRGLPLLQRRRSFLFFYILVYGLMGEGWEEQIFITTKFSITLFTRRRIFYLPFIINKQVLFGI